MELHPRPLAMLRKTFEPAPRATDQNEPTRLRPRLIRVFALRPWLMVLGLVAIVAGAGQGVCAQTSVQVGTDPAKFVLKGMIVNAGGALNDTRAVQIGSVSASQFALVADGKNGMRVVQLISPDTVPGAHRNRRSAHAGHRGSARRRR